MKFNKYFAMLLAGVMMVGGATSPVAHAATYTGYSLKALGANNYTSLHDKKTNEDYITNQVTAVTDTTYVNFWAVTSSNKKISQKYKQGVNTGKKTLKFSSGYNLGKGDEVGMGMENYENSLHTAWVSGSVNFK